MTSFPVSHVPSILLIVLRPSTMAQSSPNPAAADGDDCRDDGGAQKRPAWDDNANDRASKRRASRACLSCRSRKVRCDVVNTSVPCTNCRLDDVECVVTESNRGKRPTTLNSAAPAPHPLPPPAAATVAPPPPPAPPAQSQVITPPSSNGADDYLLSLSFEGQATRYCQCVSYEVS